MTPALPIELDHAAEITDAGGHWHFCRIAAISERLSCASRQRCRRWCERQLQTPSVPPLPIQPMAEQPPRVVLVWGSEPTPAAACCCVLQRWLLA